MSGILPLTSSPSTPPGQPDILVGSKKFDRKRRPRYGRRMDDGGSNGTWLISFTDVMGLLLTFFVMMYAMSTPRETEWQDMTQSVKENFNRFYGKPQFSGAHDAQSIQRVRLSYGLDVSYLKALFESKIAQDATLKDVQIIILERGLVLSFPDHLLFESGDSDVTSEGARAVYTMGAALQRIKNRIEVVGHTDPRPISSGEYANNWELSFDRAAKVAAILQNTGYEKPITIRGNASARYDEIDAAIPEAQRLALSRRVDIMIMEDRGQTTKRLDISTP